MTGWADDVIEEEGEEGDDRPISDGDVIGDVTDSVSRRKKRSVIGDDPIPYEKQWEIDMEAFIPSQVSSTLL